MTPSVWLSMAGLCAGLFVQVAVFAFILGRLSQRVSAATNGTQRAFTED